MPLQLECAIRSAVTRAMDGDDPGELLKVLQFQPPPDTGFFQSLCRLFRQREDGLDALRRHCLQTALLARELAADRARPGEAFVAGLLHEVHALLHGADGSDARDTLAALAGSSPQSAVLLRAWNLPATVVNAIAEHGRALQTGLAPAGGLGGVLWVAHRFAHRLDGSARIDALSAGRIAATLGLNRNALERAIAAARSRYQARVGVRQSAAARST